MLADYNLVDPGSSNMKSCEFITEVRIDNKSGAGAVPNNQEVDYFGLRVQMAPLTFLRMSSELTVDTSTEERIVALAKYINDGGAIGAPFLQIDIPDSWEQDDLAEPARIVSHEGRHRMEAVIKAEGNAPIEVHLFFPGLRARHITPNWVKRLNTNIINQRGVLTPGPWFTTN